MNNGEKILELVFKTDTNDTKIVNVVDPRDDVTAAEAAEVMQILINGDVIEVSNGGKLTEAVEARLRITQVTVLQ